MLNCLLPHVHTSVKQIFVSDKVGKSTSVAPKGLREMKFFEQTLPNQLLFPQLDAQERPLDTKLLTFKELSKKYKIPLVSWNDVKTEESLAAIRALAPDLVLSVRYGKIFGNDFLNIPRLGVINFHSGRLPNYRGVLAIFRALANGDTHINGTLHYISDSSIDTGDVIGFSTLEVSPQQSLLWHILGLYPASVELVVHTIQQISEGIRPPALPQHEADSQYFTFPTEAEIAAFEAKGWRLYDVEEYELFIKQYVEEYVA